jgi:hypothetical protein
MPAREEIVVWPKIAAKMTRNMIGMRKAKKARARLRQKARCS